MHILIVFMLLFQSSDKETTAITTGLQTTILQFDTYGHFYLCDSKGPIYFVVVALCLATPGHMAGQCMA